MTFPITSSVDTLIRRASSILRDAGIDTPEHDAKLLLAEACGVELRDVDKALVMGYDLVRLIPDEERETASGDASRVMSVTSEFHTMVIRRARREPLQYIVGHAPFRYLDLEVGPGVFIPRPETEVVVQKGLDWLSSRRAARKETEAKACGFRVVDLCAGSGAIGLSIVTETDDTEVWAVELNDRTASWTQRNAQAVTGAYGISANLGMEFDDGSAHSRYHLVRGDATAPFTLAELDGTVDLVVTNPPYVPESDIPEQPEVRNYDPTLALYGGSLDGLKIPRLIIDRATTLLTSDGALVMEHDIAQGVSLVQYALSQGFHEACTGTDWTGRPRYLFAQR